MGAKTTEELTGCGVDYPYLEIGRATRQEQAASRWALVRAADRFIASERWRRKAERDRATLGDNVARLDTRRAVRPLAPPPDWYLQGAAADPAASAPSEDRA